MIFFLGTHSENPLLSRLSLFQIQIHSGALNKGHFGNTQPRTPLSTTHPQQFVVIHILMINSMQSFTVVICRYIYNILLSIVYECTVHEFTAARCGDHYIRYKIREYGITARLCYLSLFELSIQRCNTKGLMNLV